MDQKKFDEIREQLVEENLGEHGYKCIQCENRVGLIFPLEFLKRNQICPDCFHKDQEDE